MSRAIPDDKKILAVAEALLGNDTLTHIALKYEISLGYLSQLSAKARRFIVGEKQVKSTQDSVVVHSESAEKRLSALESKIKLILDILNK
jgi:transposase-like protein